MPALIITTSPNIASLNTQVLGSLCDGKFSIDISPSVFIGDGAINVLGASIKVVNPLGVVIKNYPTSGYDIANDSPPMSTVVEVNIPTTASNYQYGTYLVTAQITDADGTVYTTLPKSVKICEPDKNHKTRNYGSLSAKLTGICKDGKLFVTADVPPNYISETVETQVNDLKLEYPTSSLVAPLIDIPLSSFSEQLYEGVWKLTGTICATYNFDDYVFIEVLYKVKKEKDIKCALDECCVSAGLVELNAKNNDSCTEEEKKEYATLSAKVLLLLKVIQLSAECSEDPSDYIADLENILGCKCTCNCAEGTPIINQAPAKDFIFEGCGFTKTVVGLTDYVTLNNYGYVLSIPDNGGILTASAVSIQDCVVAMPINFDITRLYSVVKGMADSDYNSWGAIVNKTWNGIDPTCLGLTAGQWDLLTFKQKAEAIIALACAGGKCTAEFSSISTEAIGSSVRINWFVLYAATVDIYIDGIFKGNVLQQIYDFTIPELADGLQHEYILYAKGENGSICASEGGLFQYIGCPTIAPTTVTLSSISNADCPYDLTALVNALPSGIEAEWHNANNTNSLSLVADPTNAVDGTYYVFAKNNDNCYSLGVKVILVCSVATNCSAPQNLIVENITDGFRVRFQSAAYAPPSNSYTVKRKLASDPDVDGSYTTIGTPTYNSTAARWEILDETGIDNTLYTYKAISNCTSSTPSVLYTFANITCPTVSLTAGNESVGYSFAPIGGGIDKYEVEVYDITGVTRVSIDTFVPSFANPITGTVIYLDAFTNYKIRVKVYIGSYVNICAFQTFKTDGTITIDNNAPAASITAVSNVTGFSLSSPVTAGSTLTDSYSPPFTSTISVTLSGTVTTLELVLYYNAEEVDRVIANAGPGTYTFDSLYTRFGYDILIELNDVA